MKIDSFLRNAVTVLFVLTVATLSYSNPRVPAQSGDAAAASPNENLEVDSVNMQPAPGATPSVPPTGAIAAPQDFSVKTWKPQKKSAAHAVQLVSPPHRATYTPGVITFQWKLALSSKKQKKYHFFIESHDGKTKIDRKTNNEKRLMSIGPGQYRWRVVAESPKGDSRWRSFKVIKLKSDELSRLYEGRSNRKPTAAGMTQFPEAIVVDEGDPSAEGEADPNPSPAVRAPAPRPKLVPPVQASHLQPPGARAPASIDLGDPPPLAPAQVPETAAAQKPASVKLNSTKPLPLTNQPPVAKVAPRAPSNSTKPGVPKAVAGSKLVTRVRPVAGAKSVSPLKAAAVSATKQPTKIAVKAAGKKLQAKATKKASTSSRAPASVEAAPRVNAPATPAVKFLTPKAKSPKDSLNFD